MDTFVVPMSLFRLFAEIEYYGGFACDDLLRAWIPQGVTEAGIHDIWRRWLIRRCAGGTYRN